MHVRLLKRVILNGATASACFFQAFAQHGHVTGTIYAKGKEIGFYESSRRILPGGELSSEMTLKSTVYGGHMTISYLYARSGRPIEMSWHRTTPVDVQGRVEFGAHGAKLTLKSNSKTEIKNLEYPHRANLGERTRFWFIRDHPRLGETVTFTDFDIKSQGWVSATTTYIGDEEVTYHGKTILAHKVKTDRGARWVDNMDLPYRIESNNKETLIRN